MLSLSLPSVHLSCCTEYSWSHSQLWSKYDNQGEWNLGIKAVRCLWGCDHRNLMTTKTGLYIYIYMKNQAKVSLYTKQRKNVYRKRAF